MTAGGGFEAGRPMLSWQGGSSLPWVVSVSPEDRKAALGTAAPSLPPWDTATPAAGGQGQDSTTPEGLRLGEVQMQKQHSYQNQPIFTEWWLMCVCIPGTHTFICAH